MLENGFGWNIQGADLDAIEVAISYHRIVKNANLDSEGIAPKSGKKRSTVANYLRLLKLPAEIQICKHHTIVP